MPHSHLSPGSNIKGSGGEKNGAGTKKSLLSFLIF